MMKLFFHLQDICASKISQQQFRIAGWMPVSDHMMGNINCFHEPTRKDA